MTANTGRSDRSAQEFTSAVKSVKPCEGEKNSAHSHVSCGETVNHYEKIKKF